MLSISLNQIRFILVKLILTSKMKLYTRTWVIQQTLSFTADEMEKKAPLNDSPITHHRIKKQKRHSQRYHSDICIQHHTASNSII